jgi:tetratricopeptide (TPR) repeat protein
MFRGYELRLPTSLFGRKKESSEFPTAAKPVVRGAADSAHARVMRGLPNRVAGPTENFIPRHGARTPAGGIAGSGDRPQQFGAARPAGMPQQSASMSRSLPASSHMHKMRQAVPANAVPPVDVTHANASLKSDVRSVQSAAGKSLLSQGSTTQPIQPNAAKEGTAKPPAAGNEANANAGPATTIPKAANSAAERLAAQAHEWSATAKTAPEFTRIIETCRRARVSKPNGPVAQYTSELAAWALNRRGQLKAEEGRIKEAMLDFDDAVRADSKCWRATHNRGVLLAQDGQFEKAFDDFTTTIETKPDFAKAYSNRAALFVVASNLQAALQDYERAIELDPNLAIAHRGCGRVCHLLGQLDEAVGHYDAAVQLAPEDAYAIASRADLLTDLGRYIDANADYNRAIEIDPRSEHAYSGSAWLLATCPDSTVRDPELAIKRARISIELGGTEDAVSFDTLAAAQASAGDFDAATKSVRQALDLAPADERDVYRDRLLLYQHAKPYRIAPVRPVTQASYQSEEQRAESRE